MGRSELDILARLRARLPGGEALTDDCGALPQPRPGETLLVTTDLMEEDVHFRRDWHPPRLLARKLLTVNLSDLDASGARPLGCTLTLALPPDLDPAWLDTFLDGLGEACHEAGLPVLGGDTVGRPWGLGLGLTAFGAATRWLRRDGVRPGDRIYVDQPLGFSLRGLRKLQAGIPANSGDPEVLAHLDPRPNLGLGVRLAALPEVHACMDLSDGLSRDLRNLALPSGVTIRVAEGLTPDEIQGGEDYARCFASPLPLEVLSKALDLPLREVGIALPRGEAPVVTYDGVQDLPLADQAFDHFAP